MKDFFSGIVNGFLRAYRITPYCEVNGVKFWTKRSYEKFRRSQAIEDMRQQGKIHSICYTGSLGCEAKEIVTHLIAFLDENGGYIVKKHRVNCSPGEGEVRLAYACDKEFDWRRYDR